MKRRRKVVAVALVLVAAAIELAFAACQGQTDILCTCDATDPNEATGLFLTFSAFDEASTVTVSNCHNVTFIGGYSYPHPQPPTLIRFFNIQELRQQPLNDEEERWGETGKISSTATIERIEFVNISRVHDLHLKQLFSLNRVETLLLKNITEISQLSGRRPSDKPSIVTEVKLEDVKILKELRTGAFHLIHNRLFSMVNVFAFFWRQKAVEIEYGWRLSIANSKISFLETEGVDGMIEDKAEILKTVVRQMGNHAFPALANTKRLHINNNEFRLIEANAFNGIFTSTHKRTITFSNNSLPCPSPTASPPLCLAAVGGGLKADNNSCFDHGSAFRTVTQTGPLYFHQHYNVYCSSLATSGQPIHLLSPQILLIFVPLHLHIFYTELTV